MQCDQFTIKHFAGSVTYDVAGFLEKNNDSLQVLHGLCDACIRRRGIGHIVWLLDRQLFVVLYVGQALLMCVSSFGEQHRLS